MRYTDKVKLNSRLKWGSRYLYITDISDDKAKGTMKLMCREAATG
jgi:head-tail adaptor